MSDKEKKVEGEISRREFLKDAGLIIGGVATGSTALVSAKAIVPGTTPAAEPAQAGQTVPPAEKPAWQIPPPPIPDSDIKTTLNADIVVVGAGASGLFAALAAARAGSKVILIEKAETLQGRGGDNTAIDSKIQKKLGIQLDKDSIIHQLMKWGGSRLNESILRLWANNSGRVMDEIIDMMDAEGLPVYLVRPDRTDAEAAVIDKWPNPTGFPEGWDYLNEASGVVEYPTCHRPIKIGTGQADWLKIVEKNIVKAGAEIHYKTQAKQLVREANNGKVTAVVAQDADGKYVRLNAAKAVILCTGDYGSNPDMVAYYGNLMPGMVATSQGEGQQMGMWIGGVMENRPHAPMSHSWGAMGQDAFLEVNNEGKRFWNEDMDTESVANQAFEQGGFWTVLDSTWPEDVGKMGVGFFKIWKATDTVKKEFEKKVTAGTMLKADTIEELAQKMKVPVETFKATIARYNELVKAGKDADFGKRADRLTAVDTPPFYAGFTVKPTRALVVLGGLITNEKLQPVDAEGKVIPGLFVAGNMVGRRFKGGYPVMLPGLSHSMAWTTGYLAGEFATAKVEA